MSLLSDLEDLPDEPGIYLIKDKEDKVIYVGKAKDLKSRVKQHFQNAFLPKEEKLQELANRVDWILTRNESEALILEKKLIHQLSPKLNSMLKDDKSHLLLRVTLEEKYPQLLIVRETDLRNEKSIYFGPFTKNTMLRQTAKLVLRLFPICNCGKNVENLRKRGTNVRCMREKLGRCLAPCKNDITSKEYKKTVRNVISFLKGDVADLLDNLESEMWSASKVSNFEKAVILRDLVQAVRTIMSIQQDIDSKRKNIDILAFEEEENSLAICKLEVRNHRVQNIRNYIYSENELLNTVGEIVTFIYGQNVPEYELVAKENLTERFKPIEDISITSIEEDTDEQLVSIAARNARNELLKFLKDKQYQEISEVILENMKEDLNLPNIPNIIHGFDISTLKGQFSVGSCIVFEDGKPQKKLYRRFRIRKTYTDPDDYAMMEEIILRRYKSEILKNDPLPDLIIIDGGKGQLNIAKKVLEKLQLPFPVISIAKKNEEIFVDWSEEPLIFEQESPVLKLVQYVRNESHRFAINYHKLLRSKAVKSSIFEKIKGIGKRKVQLLFVEYKGLEEIASATIEDIKEVLAVNDEIASKVIEMARGNIKEHPYENE
ncbi:MAG: excinuclease ABC subunit UvrC [Candidatus Heimdallarchaeota archaeon]|nr:excinuclease ABC subunit UvrC [Candidatus Heimdallarchaeota archaeon]MCK4955068.1 excinuclease ABC subunit UvrC [Candidatus Heimdallarchaeota archaeon]